jgi:hypothetical protein
VIVLDRSLRYLFSFHGSHVSWCRLRVYSGTGYKLMKKLVRALEIKIFAVFLGDQEVFC